MKIIPLIPMSWLPTPGPEFLPPRLNSWTDKSDNEDGFILQRQTEDGEFAVIDTIDAGITEYQDESAEFNTNYTYKVASFRQGSGTASDVSVISDFSHEGSVMVLWLENARDNSMIRIYPNPSTGIIYISLAVVREFPVQYSLSNVEGRIIRQSSLDRNRNSIDIGEFNTGMYVLLLDIDGVYVRKKVLKY